MAGLEIELVINQITKLLDSPQLTLKHVTDKEERTIFLLLKICLVSHLLVATIILTSNQTTWKRQTKVFLSLT